MPLIKVVSLAEPVWASLMNVFVRFDAHWRRKRCLVSLPVRIIFPSRASNNKGLLSQKKKQHSRSLSYSYDAYEGWPRKRSEDHRRELSDICLIMLR